MAERVPLTLHENNDEVLALTITPVDDGEDLTTVTSLELYLKTDDCADDEAEDTLVLTTAESSEIVIDSQAADLIEATAYIPAAALQGGYDRFWRLDALVNTQRRTALYGPVKVVRL